jgi:sensor histidine kinase YesM
MFHEMYQSKFSKAMVRLYLIIFILYQIVITVTEPIIYTRLADLTNLIDVVAILCTMVIIIIGLMKGHKDAWLNICCLIIILTTYIHDILFWTNQIRSDYGEIIYIGVFLCVLLQVLLQTRRIRQFYNQTVATELAFLQAQIKPHFLYNAINTFISITYYDVEQARELLRNFADYLRRSFDFRSLDQFAPLKSELELVKAYVAIEQVRFEDRLEVNFDIPENMEYKVPILIIQPIVENAVLHGVLPKAEGGHVFIKIREEGKMLNFAVRDDGIGMEIKSNTPMENKTGSRVGLNNISKRLKKLYGKGLLVESKLGKGTVISWSIPIKGGKSRWK